MRPPVRAQSTESTSSLICGIRVSLRCARLPDFLALLQGQRTSPRTLLDNLGEKRYS